ncbi:MAG TPA: hypothetical protein VKT32_15840, partial [Chthonomonadaceae bacterium]|nr:hypothetical protein [Chthonomonadaceae bacterium]
MSARRDPYLPALCLIVIVAIGVRCFLLTAHATEEDFYITLRYAQNIAHGLGFVYNPGAHVLGATTPLYTLILALLFRLHLDPVFWAKLMGIAADGVTGIAIYRLGRAIGRPGAGLAAALCVALLPVNLIWATKGMEVELVAATGAIAWAAWAEEREMLAWGAAAFLVLLRIDGAALAVFLLVGALLWEWRLPWRGLLLFLLLLLPWLMFATLYFGSPVPASVTAKLHVYAHSPTIRFPRLGEFLALMRHNVGWMLLLGCALAAAAWIRTLLARRAEPARPTPSELRLVPPGLWIASYYASMAFSPVFLFGWYFVPPTPLYYLIAMTGWSLFFRQACKYLFYREGSHPFRRVMDSPFGRALNDPYGGPSDNRPAGGTFQQDESPQGTSGPCCRSFNCPPLVSCGLVVAAAALLTAVFVPRVLRDLRSGQAAEQALRIPIGLWLRANAHPT